MEKVKHFWFMARRYNECAYITISYYDTKQEAEEALKVRRYLCTTEAEEYIIIRLLVRFDPAYQNENALPARLLTNDYLKRRGIL